MSLSEDAEGQFSTSSFDELLLGQNARLYEFILLWSSSHPQTACISLTLALAKVYSTLTAPNLHRAERLDKKEDLGPE